MTLAPYHVKHGKILYRKNEYLKTLTKFSIFFLQQQKKTNKMPKFFLKYSKLYFYI